MRRITSFSLMLATTLIATASIASTIDKPQRPMLITGTSSPTNAGKTVTAIDEKSQKVISVSRITNKGNFALISPNTDALIIRVKIDNQNGKNARRVVCDDDSCNAGLTFQ